jgi:SIR2-like domain
MIRTDLIELLNSGATWAFIGSGASVDAGGPTWQGLLDRTLESLSETEREKIASDALYADALSASNYARCFSRLIRHAGPDAVHDSVRQILAGLHTPGKLVNLLVELPFAGYITSNYDHLLELALREQGHLGWVPVGNTENEVRKVSGEAPNLVWHVHGTVYDTPQSSLILSEEDYDRVYLEDSYIVQQLRALLTQRRIFFIGFGFSDPELLRILKRVGKLANPARPLIAFIGERAGVDTTEQRQLLLAHYNVDILPYTVRGSSHERLLELLLVYSSFTLRRSLRFGSVVKSAPSYDPETTGLLIYNRLFLGPHVGLGTDVQSMLVRARILALLNYAGAQSLRNLEQSLAPSSDEVVARTAGGVASLLEPATLELQRLGLIESEQVGDEIVMRLTPAGSDKIAADIAQAERLREQFTSSLHTRAHSVIPGEQAVTVASAASAFFNECIERRALGIAQVTIWGDETRAFHMAALLQHLPTFMQGLESQEQAIALSRVVQDVLSDPSDTELQFIGLALQARFGVHLLGADPDTVKARLIDFERTMFVIDSSTLIPYLAKGSIGHPAAQLLVEKLKRMKAPVVTTSLLAEEVAEHVRWALRRVSATGDAELGMLGVASGRAGERGNAFVDGFISSISTRVVYADFFTYLADCFQRDGRLTDCTVGDVCRALQALQVICRSLREWEGFEPALLEDAERVAYRIEQARRARQSYRHERQVKAEGKALTIIRGLREGRLRYEGCEYRSAYFVSHTRVIDEVAQPNLPITMRPEAVLHWLSTIAATSLEEIASVTNGLLWELSERGLSIVKREVIRRVFQPLLAASKEQLESELRHHRALVAERYGEKSINAFKDADLLDTPFVVQSYFAQEAAELKRQLETETEGRKRAERKAVITQKEREQLERLKMQEKLRKEAAKRKKRKGAQRSKKRSKKR